MLKDWLVSTQTLLARLRIQTAPLSFTPRFRLTSLVLWIVALAGLTYGHIINQSDSARTLSLFLSGISALGSLFLVLVRDPWQRLQIFARQLIGLILLIAAGILLLLTHAVWQAESADALVKLVWSGGTILMLTVGLRVTYLAYANLESSVSQYYPGMRSASVLMGLFLVNYLIWTTKAFWLLIR